MPGFMGVKMAATLVEGLSYAQIAAGIRRGDITKIAQSMYCWGDPSPREVIDLLAVKHPECMLTGRTAAELLLEEALTLPLHIASKRRVPVSRFYNINRTRFDSCLKVQGIRVQNPLFAMQFVSAELGIAVFEKIYASRNGRKLLEAHRSALTKFPRPCREMLSQAVLFTDSGAELKVAKALRACGLKVECNVFIGRHVWDIVLPELKIAVEINGLEFHSERKEWIRDHWKNNEAVLRGWRTLRYTGHCVYYHLDYVVEQITTADDPDWTRRFYHFVTRWHRAVMPKEPAPWEYSGEHGWFM